MKSLKKPDGSYLFDITRSENLVATMLGLINREISIFKMNETENEFIFGVGDLSKDVPLDSLTPDVEMSISKEFYEKTVTSAYADEIIQLAPTLSSMNEFAKFFLYSGNLLGIQLALMSYGYYSAMQKNFNTLPVSELLNAMYKFQGAFKEVYKNFLISNELFDEKDFGSYSFIDPDTIVNHIVDATRNGPSVSGDTIKNSTPVIFSMMYYSLFQTLCGVFLTVVGGLNHSVRSLFQIATDVSAPNVISLIVNNQLDILGPNTQEGLNDTKKIFLGLLSAFYRVHTYIETFTGYSFNDPMAILFSTLGKELYHAKKDEYDDLFIDTNLLFVGSEFGITLDSITNIVHPIMGYSSFGDHTLKCDSSLPFALVSPIHIFMNQVENIDDHYENSFTRLKKYVADSISTDGFDEKEMYKGFLRVLVADSQADASELDIMRFFKVAAAAAYLKDEKDDIAQTASVIADNYLAALYIKWFKSGNLYRSTRDMVGGGLESYHSLHQEALMVVSYYQEYLTSKSKDVKIDSAGSYQSATMSNLAYRWLNSCGGSSKYESATEYIPYFITNLRNVTIAINSPEDFARCIQERSVAAITAEVIALIDQTVSLTAIVQKFESNTNEITAQKDITSITAKFDIDQFGHLADVVDILKGDTFEKRCFIIGGTVRGSKGVNPMDYVAYFVGIPVETMLTVWENAQSTVIDAKGVFQGNQLKFREIGTSFIDGGIANSLRQKAQSYNPMK